MSGLVARTGLLAAVGPEARALLDAGVRGDGRLREQDIALGVLAAVALSWSA